MANSELKDHQCACPITGQAFESEADFDAYIGPRPTTGPDLDLDFKRNGFKLDTGSGYSRKAKQQDSYWLVVKGDKPLDLVHETPEKATSMVESVKLEKHKRRLASDYFPLRDDLTYIALNREQYLALCAPKKLAAIGRRSGERKSPHRSEEFKAEVLADLARATEQRLGWEADHAEALRTGEPLPAVKHQSIREVASQHGVALSTLQRWAAEQADAVPTSVPATTP